MTIIPRGRALGVTMSLPEEDKYSSSRTELENRIAILFGGRAAELVIFDRYTTGASNDIKQATKIARSMVCQLGMSEVVGPMAIGDQSQEVFIGREWVANRDHSEETARMVDAEVKRIIDTAMNRAMQLLKDNLPILHAMSEALLERETLTGEDVDLLMAGKPLPPMDAEQYRRKRERHDAAQDKGGNGSGNAPEGDAHTPGGGGTASSDTAGGAQGVSSETSAAENVGTYTSDGYVSSGTAQPSSDSARPAANGQGPRVSRSPLAAAAERGAKPKPDAGEPGNSGGEAGTGAQSGTDDSKKGDA